MALSGAAAVACLFRSLRALDTPTLPALGAAAFFDAFLHEQAGQPEAAQEVFVRALLLPGHPKLTRASLQRMKEHSPVAAKLLVQLTPL